APVGRRRPLPGPGHTSPALARRPRPGRQARRRDRIRRHSRDADPRDSREGGARDDAAAIAHLLLRPAHHARARRDAGPAGPPREWTHETMPRQYMMQYHWLARTSFEAPDELHTFLIESIRPLLPEGFDVDKHLTPRYRPWQQRIAIIPDGDLFAALREGKASIVTDTIETFTEHGIRVSSGEEIPADIVVTATGFNLSVLGDVAFTVDGEPVDFTERVTWRGIMINGLPNMAYVFGYFRHSWTLRVDLVSDLVGRVLENMRNKGATMVVPVLPPEDADMQLRPWADPENFNSGYVMRSQHLLFKQGDREPWTHQHEHEQE